METLTRFTQHSLTYVALDCVHKNIFITAQECLLTCVWDSRARAAVRALLLFGWLVVHAHSADS